MSGWKDEMACRRAVLYLLGNLCGIHKVHVQVVAKLGDAGSDLVKDDALLTTVYGGREVD